MRLHQHSARAGAAVVAGAAGRVGLGVVRTLLAHGWRVAGHASTQAGLAAAAAQLDAGARFVGLAGDLAAPQTAARLLDLASERFGTIELLVTHAGAGLPRPLGELLPEEVEPQIGRAVRGVVGLAREAARRMDPHGGTIVNITADIAPQPHSSTTAFLAVLLKGRLNAATESLARELAPRGIRVSAVAPGLFDVPRPTHPGPARPPCRGCGASVVADAVLGLAGRADHTLGAAR